MALKDMLIIGGLAVLGYVLVWKFWPGGRIEPRRPASVEPTARGLLWHEVLGVNPRASVPEITKAYRSLVSQYHPDKVAQLGAEIRHVAEEKTKQLNAAYEEGVALRRVGM